MQPAEQLLVARLVAGRDCIAVAVQPLQKPAELLVAQGGLPERPVGDTLPVGIEGDGVCHGATYAVLRPVRARLSPMRGVPFSLPSPLLASGGSPGSRGRAAGR